MWCHTIDGNAMCDCVTIPVLVVPAFPVLFVPSCVTCRFSVPPSLWFALLPVLFSPHSILLWACLYIVFVLPHVLVSSFWGWRQPVFPTYVLSSVFSSVFSSGMFVFLFLVFSLICTFLQPFLLLLFNFWFFWISLFFLYSAFGKKKKKKILPICSPLLRPPCVVYIRVLPFFRKIVTHVCN